MDNITCYEFSVQIWFDDGVWNWGIFQEWESGDTTEVEGLSYGTADDLESAVVAVAEEMKQIKFSS